jgi:hypothetical protein
LNAKLQKQSGIRCFLLLSVNGVLDTQGATYDYSPLFFFLPEKLNSFCSSNMSDHPYRLVEEIRQSPPVDTSAPYDAAWVAGKTILITGGASGFGEGFFRKWADHGANVIIGGNHSPCRCKIL